MFDVKVGPGMLSMMVVIPGVVMSLISLTRIYFVFLYLFF
jgi:hypothetical protein